MICDDAYSVSLIGTSDYFLTTTTAAHELAHNLGADHDGEGNAKSCRANDSFIMSPYEPVFTKDMPYSRNPWIFSNCSVDAFKNVSKSKRCLRSVGVVYNDMEWKNFMTKLPGQIFLPDEQCKIINGANSYFCGVCTLYVLPVRTSK
ncbi:hypothetical protein CHS0354_024307 [Potamilus streckersoni]|uniref:Peptidase M12B domain-containing protein n=1 Tax=Potamilus streckersoni TaxID=2493646 RepID=A0AAE0RNA8_9BIVA|nr:hypothetical protein CHS0354_024307 [Potamilus streckersoni]